MSNFRWPYNYFPLASEEFKAVCESLGFRIQIKPQKGSHGAEFYVFNNKPGQFATDEFNDYLKECNNKIDGGFRTFFITYPVFGHNIDNHKFYVSYRLKK